MKYINKIGFQKPCDFKNTMLTMPSPVQKLTMAMQKKNQKKKVFIIKTQKR